MTETKQQNWLPWILVAGLAYFAFVRQSADKPVEPVQPVVSVSKTLDAAYKADRLSKIEILKGLETMTFPSDQAKLDWQNSEAEKRRIADFQQYANALGKAIVDGKVKEMREALESGK